MKKVLFQNQNAIDAHLEQVAINQKYLQGYVNLMAEAIRELTTKSKTEKAIQKFSMETLKVPFLFKRQRFERTIFKEIIADLITPDRPTVEGVPVSAEQLKNLIDVSPGVLEKLSQYVSGHQPDRTSVFETDMTIFQIDGNKVVLPDAEKQRIIEKYQIIATSQKQVDLFNDVSTVASTLERLKKADKLANFDLKSIPFIELARGRDDFTAGLNFTWLKQHIA